MHKMDNLQPCTLLHRCVLCICTPEERIKDLQQADTAHVCQHFPPDTASRHDHFSRPSVSKAGSCEHAYRGAKCALAWGRGC